jgi:glycine/D-amino acid oxidase-like deaminating enzyme
VSAVLIPAGTNSRLNIYPAKGYSVTIPLEGANRAPTTSLTDDQYKLVYSNLGDRLRVAGTAELSGYTCNLNADRCKGSATVVADCASKTTSTPVCRSSSVANELIFFTPFRFIAGRQGDCRTATRLEL